MAHELEDPKLTSVWVGERKKVWMENDRDEDDFNRGYSQAFEEAIIIFGEAGGPMLDGWTFSDSVWIHFGDGTSQMLGDWEGDDYSHLVGAQFVLSSGLIATIESISVRRQYLGPITEFDLSDA